MAAIEAAALVGDETMKFANGWLEISDVDGVVGWRIPVNYVTGVTHEHYSPMVMLQLVTNQMIELEGVSRHDALRIVQMANQSDRLKQLERQARNAKMEAGRRNMIIGGLICTGGGIFTWASYSSADPGDQYTVAIGALVFGALQLVYGAIQSRLG